MPLVHPNGSTRPRVPWCGYSALPLQSVINLSIAESTVTDTLESRSHHGSTFNKSCTLSYKLFTVDDVVKIILGVDQVLVVVVIAGRITV